MFKKLRIRLTLICAGVTSLILVVMIAVMVPFALMQASNEDDRAFQSAADAAYGYILNQKVIDHLWLARIEQENEVMLSVEQEGKSLLFGVNNEDKEALMEAARSSAPDNTSSQSSSVSAVLFQPESSEYDMSYEGESYRCITIDVPRGEEKTSLVVVKNKQGEEQRKAGIVIMALALGLIGCALLTLFSWFFVGRAVRPVEESSERQKRFTSAASHELRSPLAVIRSYAEAIQTAPPEKAQLFSRKIEEESERLTRLTDSLLKLANADREASEVTRQTIEPETIVLSACEYYEAVAQEKEIHMQAEFPDEDLPVIEVDREAIEQILSIFIDNALSYTPKKGCLRVSVVAENNSVQFCVEDSGPGIPNENKAKVFERFYQGDSARTDKKHYGLGLSLAQEIAALQHGTVSVDDSALGGARFMLEVPCG